MRRLLLCVALALAPVAAQSAPERQVCTDLDGELGKAANSLEMNGLLFKAAKEGCSVQLARLLKAGASRLSRNRDGDTALAIAARGGRKDIVAMLLSGATPQERGQIDMVEAHGATPLMLAIHAGRSEVARTLIDAGADVSKVDALGETALAEAAYAADEGAGEALLARHAKVDTVDRDGKSPICYAAARGASGLVGQLLDAGVDVNAGYGHGLTALMWAAGPSNLAPQARTVATVRLLLARGARVDAVDDRGYSALTISAALNQPEIARVLLAAGANRALRDKAGQTAADHAGTEDMRALVK